MNIMVGIEDKTTVEDIGRMAEAGASEFFCGIMPKAWVERYGYQVSLNRREWEQNQFHTLEKLSVIIEKAHSLNTRIAVAFNAPGYYKAQVPFIEKYFRQLKEINVDALIVSNVVLMLILKDIKLKFDVYMSGTAGTYNPRSLEYYSKLGAKRILFPRDMSVAEMETVIRKTKHLGLEYEAFIMGERCPFTESYCYMTHGFLDTLFCHNLWRKNIFMRLPHSHAEVLRTAPEDFPRADIRTLKLWSHNVSQYRAWSSGGFLRSFKVKDNSVEECGLCAIKKLENIGINSFKVVGRGRLTKIKLYRLNLIRQVLDNNNAAADFCRGIREYPEICETGYKCYYPEMRR
jgi:collagenase-like PrtC family protease